MYRLVDLDYLKSSLGPNITNKSKAQIPLDSCRTTCRTTCRRPGRRQVGDQVSDFFSAQNLSETRFPTFLLVENLPLDLSRHVEIDLSCRRPGFRLFFCSKTCRKPGFKQVLSMIDVMEFGHYRASNLVEIFVAICALTSCKTKSRILVQFRSTLSAWHA